MRPNPLSPYIKPPEWHRKRLGGLGGSDANILAEGNPERIYDLWLLKTGRKQPVDLLNLPVLLGMATEDLNRHWFESVTGRAVWDYGSTRAHPKHDWLKASLDGVTTSWNGREAYWEAKAVNAFSKMPVLIKRYTPQCTHVMACGGWSVAVLSVILGNKHFMSEIEFDHWYWLDLLDVEQAFWRCVIENREPDAACLRGVR